MQIMPFKLCFHIESQDSVLTDCMSHVMLKQVLKVQDQWGVKLLRETGHEVSLHTKWQVPHCCLLAYLYNHTFEYFGK